ncbi:putative pentatricopeptide repeat-containing protein At3g13770, mitochondrial [Solanum stenotomum]|uniref:putative pentatricopeptide repeat-containing protein At3g13770, mitochondrial n=1 Tax=Solanum stenotomum TaxID=172797 RepID=UPI0020D11374|nr:putative pentatricopeptide repeat-containing protein At3g13770, mitochondrial [Solanum stenotomum]
MVNPMNKMSLFLYTSKHVFSSMIKKPYFYEQRQLLYGCLSCNGSLSEALFEMAKQGLQVKFKEYDILLNECINQRAIREGQRVHANMIKTHYQPPVYLRTRLIVFYIKCGLLGDARWVFDEMPQRNVVSWTALISGYSQKGHISQAIHLFLQMLTSGTAPNEFTFATVLTLCTSAIGFQFGRQIHCLLVKSPFESHVYVGSSLLDMYAKAGKVHEARYVFENLPERDVVSCTAIISGYAQQGLFEEALELFCKFQAERMSFNYVTYTSVSTALSGLAAVEQGRQLHAHIIRLELPFYAVLHNSLIDMYSKCGKFTYSRMIFNQMSERTVSSWNAMLVGYSKHGMGKEVVELFKMMREEDKIQPDEITLLAVLSGCSHGGMEDKGVEIFNDLSSGKDRVEVSIEHCGCVVDLLSRSGQVERAFQFIKEMPFEPTAAILGSLLGACWAHLYVDIGEIVARQLLEIEPENAGTYVILSNMYASAGRWEDARRVRELINARAMVKESGKSWIGPDFIHDTEKHNGMRTYIPHQSLLNMDEQRKKKTLLHCSQGRAQTQLSLMIYSHGNYW